ncbi:importin-7 [Desmophyllum pertusum]|uniref:Importin-7 n=1 Tax=Desmophyllum pertusum TaxID=174260 RepID=A0A9W9YX26_9CNID|nr:importin-7 [Desmophyllum pertusum]
MNVVVQHVLKKAVCAAIQYKGLSLGGQNDDELVEQMLTESSVQEDQQCNAAKLLEVTILQCHGHIDQVTPPHVPSSLALRCGQRLLLRLFVPLSCGFPSTLKQHWERLTREVEEK